MSSKIEFYKSRDIGLVFSDTFKFIRENRKILFRSLFTMAFPFSVAAVFLLVLAFSGLIESLYNSSQNTGSIVFFVFQLLIGLFLIFVAAVMFFTVTIEIMREYHLGETENLTVRHIWDKVKNIIIGNGVGFIVWLLVYSMIAGTLSVISSFALIGLGVFALSQGAYVIYTILMGCNFAFQILLAIYIFNATFPMLIISQLERINIGSALGKSFALIHHKGNFWSSIGVTLFGFIINYILLYNLFIPISISMGFVAFNTVDLNLEPGTLLFNLIFKGVYPAIYLFSTLLFIINIVSITFKYLDMNENKNLTGTLSKLEKLELLSEEKPEYYEQNF